MAAASRKEDKDQDLIRITHYINPHNFWFKHESAYAYNPEEQQFQLELNNFCEQTFGRGNLTSGIYTPRREGELVAVFYFQLSRWIRAEVDEIQEDLSGQIHCNLWAIDEGVPLKTSCRYVKPLPEKFGRFEGSVKHGGLEGILPAESGYDYLVGKVVTKKATRWAPGVVRVFESCIEEAVSIRFCDQRRHLMCDQDIYLGTMKITSHQNVTNDARDLLRKAGGKLVILVDKPEFYDEFPFLHTLDMKRFEDNESRENMKYFGNTFRPEYTARSMVKQIPREEYFQDDPVIKQAREKFLEWDKRNEASSSTVLWEGSSSYFPRPTGLDYGAVFDEKPKSQKSPLDYKQLVNESLSDEELEEESNFDHKHQGSRIEKSQPESPPSVYQKPGSKIYDKSFSDIQEGLLKIKLRRRATIQRREQELAMQQSKSNTNDSSSATLNIVPAGFNLGQVDLSTGSAVLGIANERNDQRKGACRYPDGGLSFGDKAKSSYAPKKSYNGYRRQEDLDSSFEEEMVRKLTIHQEPIRSNGYDEEDERW